MISPFSSCARDGDDPVLKRLWAEYGKAVDADRPKDQADILERIKKEASARHLAWDYYDACWKYVEARSSTNWKLHDELRAQAYSDIERYGEPVAVFYTRKESASAEDLLAYVNEKKDLLLKARNPRFYDNDSDLSNFAYSGALRPKIANDYEYALWSLLGKSRSDTVSDAVKAYFTGRYPYDAFVDYTVIGRKPASVADEEMAGYVSAHRSQAVSMLGRQYLLQRRRNKLDWSQGSSEEYRQLAQDCQTFIADRKNFSGDEKAIADCCNGPDGILETLTAQEISLDVEKGLATFVVRNLPSVRVRILDGKKELFDRTVDNPVKSFYLRDTLTLDLADLDDKTYTLKCSGGKVETETEYAKYTLSIAHKRDLDGYGVYVADYITGEPVKSCDILLFDNKGRQVDKAEGLVIDGFTYLPESMTSRLDDDKWGWTIQASTRIDGLARMSRQHQFNYLRRDTVSTDNPSRHAAMLLTDRTAFNPDETVYYKVLLYEGTYEYATRPAGIRLTATLTDPTDKEIGTQELTTNEFGSAAGSFVLKKGERGGMYRISVREGGRTIAETRVRADEFVLPSFELSWKPDSRFYLPGDFITVEGGIRSYSGHNLGTATATYSVEDRGETLDEGKLELAGNGDFKIRFQAPDDESRWYHNLVVTVRVTDATGETLEFRKTVDFSQSLPLNIRVMNRVQGHFNRVSGSSGGSIVGDSAAQVRFQLGGGGSPKTHPRLSIEYAVSREGKTLLSGNAKNGENVSLDLSRHPSGLYTVEVRATAVSDTGKEYVDIMEHDIVKVEDADSALDLDVHCFFKELADDGTGISLQVGATTGPAWIVTELYGDGNRLLEKRIVKLAGVRARPNSLQVIRFDRKADYPETLTLKVLWFRDGRAFDYSVSSYKPKLRFELPLGFTRFLDTTAPHHDYRFTIRTAEGVELAATIFDKSTETIGRNVWNSVFPATRSLPEVYYRNTLGIDSAYAFDAEALNRRQSNRILSKSAAMGSAVLMDEAAPMAEMAREAMVADDAMPEESLESEEGGAEEISVRENFANTIAWEPFLRSDKDGTVTFNFTTADKLSTYYVQLFAHDKAFHNATLRREMVVTLPVKVAVVQPQFLYEGDRYVARVTVSNSKETPVPGRISVKFLNGKDYKTAPVLADKGGRLTVPGGGTVDYSCETVAPGVRDLGLLVSFTADNADYGSDAVFVVMPVSPAVQTITEAHSALLRAGMDRESVLADLRSQFVNVSGSEAALREISILGMIQEAIPEKVLPRSENLLDQSEALYANFLIDKLPGSKGSGATPEQRADMVNKILGCHNSDGGFGWFAGMTTSPILTITLLERLADMGEDCPAELAAQIPAAVLYLDNEYFGGRRRPFWCGGISLEQYLHVRARYPQVAFSPEGVSAKVMRLFKKEVRSYLVPGTRRGLNGQVFAKARRMKTLRALLGDGGVSLAQSWGISLLTSSRLRKSLDKDIASLLQYAEPHRSGGTYYPNAVMPWRGLLESELYAHALICDLLTDCGHNEVAEGIRLWIMVQKETQHWEDDPAYIPAIGSVLRGTEETLQTRVLALTASTTLPFPQIKASGNGFTLSRSFTRDGQPLADGDLLHVGDKVVATYSIWNEENRSFVRLTAPRPAAFRPVEQLSGPYGWRLRPISITGWMSFSPQGYRSVLADRTEYWFDSYPEENTTVTEEYFVTQEGSFQCPVPVIESLYAPHYRANDGGHPAVSVKP
ncbi:MAG: hypothetical protein GXY24_00915 [Bacteroidales bacterium]|nr:hypothetical protein [Bacteroidales bacterium]